MKTNRFLVLLLIAVMISGIATPASALGKSNTDRFVKAVNISLEGWENGSEIVYLSGVDVYAEALDTYGNDAPVLLTIPQKLPDATLEEIGRLGADKVYLVEGSSLISESVELVLLDLGLEVERITITHGVRRQGPPVPSTYSFDFQKPETIKSGEPVSVDVTLATETLGDKGYKDVRCKFFSDKAGVIFFGTDSNGQEYSFTDQGYWGPAKGFDIPAEYSVTTQWILTFNQRGTYTITVQLIDAKTEEVLVTGSQVIEVTDDFIRLTKTEVNVKTEIQLDSETSLVDGLKITACTETDSDPLESEGQQYQVSGTVIDPNYNPIAGAQVILWCGDYGLSEEAGDDGAFELYRPAGTYTLEIKAQGYKPYSQILTVSEPEPEQEPIRTLSAFSSNMTMDVGVMAEGDSYPLTPQEDTPMYTVSGTVFDGEYNPLGDVWITAYCVDTHYQEYMKTGSDGFYSLSIAAGEYIFFTSVEGYNGIGTKVIVGSDLTNKNWVLDYVGKEILPITGQVIDAETSEPLMGVSVGAWSTSSGDYVYTDDNGFYSMELPAGDYDFHLRLDGYFPIAALNYPITSSEPVNWDLQSVGDLFTISGTVTNKDGLPIPGAQVLAGGIDFRYGAYTYTDAYGAYSLDLPMADYMFEVLASGYLLPPEMRKVEGNAFFNWTMISVEDLATVEGSVYTPDGYPATGALIDVQARGSYYYDRVYTDSQGQYSLKLPAGVYFFTIQWDDGYITSGQLTVPEGGYLSKDWFLDDAGELFTITGNISSQGEPIPLAFIDAECSELNYLYYEESDIHGNYSLELYAGEYQVRVRADGYFTETVSYTVSGPGELNWDLTPLGELATLSGYITDEMGLPVVGAEVLIGGRDTEFWDVQISDSQGYYSAQVPLGAYDFTIMMDGFYRESTVLHIQEDTVMNWSLQSIGDLFTLSGRILDAQGNGIPGVEVGVHRQGELYSTWAFTGYDGGFSMEVPAGYYVISLQSEYGLREIFQTIDEDTFLEFVLNQPVEISGMVTDYLGYPLEDVTIIAERYEPADGTWHWECQGVTDLEGCYALEVTPDAQYRLFFQRDANLVKSISVWVGDTDITVDMQFDEVCLIQGQVTDGVNPISDVFVLFRLGDHGEGVYTDAEGRYSYWAQPGIISSITFYHDEYWTKELYEVEVAAPVVTVDCILDMMGPKYELSGTVTSSSGEVLPGIELGVTHTERDFRNNIFTEDDGTFSMLIPNGTYDVFTHDPSGRFNHFFGQVVIDNGGVTLDITLQSQVLIAGKVTNAEGLPIAGVQVQAWNEEEYFFAWTDETGSYSLGVSPNHSYSARFSHDDYWTSVLTEVIVGTEDITLDDVKLVHAGPKYQFSGTVSAGLSPVQDVWVDVYHIEGKYSKYACTDMNGNFIMELPNGTYSVSIYQPGYSEYYNEILIADGSETLDIELQSAAQISGIVSDEYGNPLADIFVTALDAEGNMVDMWFTGSDGFFTFSVPDGLYNLRFSSYDYWVQTLEDVPSGETLDVTMIAVGPKYDITGTILYEGNPMSGIYVRFEEINGRYLRSAASGELGEIYPQLPAATYNVTALDEAGEYGYSGQIIVSGDMSIEINLQLTP